MMLPSSGVCRSVHNACHNNLVNSRNTEDSSQSPCCKNNFGEFCVPLPALAVCSCGYAAIKPFAALRPEPKLAARICELPYDVMSSDKRVQSPPQPAQFFARQQTGN